MKEEDKNALGCLAIIFSPFLLVLCLLVLLLLLIALCWVVPAVLYFFAGLIFWIWGVTNNNNKYQNIFNHFAIMSGIFALIPLWIFLCNVYKIQEIPSNTTNWAFSFYAINWFSFISGFIYSITNGIALLISERIYKIKLKSQLVMTYTVAILQFLTATLVIEYSIYKGEFTDVDLLIAIIPTLPMFLCIIGVFIIIALYNKLTEEIKIQSLYKKGDKLYKKGQYEEALKVYDKAFSLDKSKNSSYYYYAIGMVYYAQKDYSRAVYMLQQFYDKTGLPDAILAIAEILGLQGKYEKGLECYDVLLSVTNKDSEDYKKYQQHKNNYLSEIEKIKEENKKQEAKILYDKALQYIEGMDYKNAKHNLQEALKITPDNKIYQNTLSEIQDLYNKAIEKTNELYKKAQELNEGKSYKKSLDVVNEGIAIAKIYGIVLNEFESLRKNLTTIIKNHDIAEEKYITSKKSYQFKDYHLAMLNIKEAISLNPDNEQYKNFLSMLQKNIDELSIEVSDLLNDFEVAKNNGDFKKAMYFINEAIKCARDKKLDTSPLTKTKNDFIKYTENIEKAKSSYNRAMAGYKYKNYKNTISDLEKAVTLTPENQEYKNKLQEIKSEYEKIRSKADKHYIEAKNFYKKEDFKNAKSSINKAIKLLQIQEYIDLSNDIDNKQQKLIDEQKAEKLYNEAISIYNSSNSDYEQVFNLLDKAIRLTPKKIYKDLRGKIKHDRDVIVAESLYEEAKICFGNNDFEKALSLVKESIKLSPSNRIYIDLKQKIDWEQKEFQKRQEAEEYYKSAVECYNDGEFSNTIEYLKEALDLQPNNEIYENLLGKAKDCKIDIMTCAKNALLTLDFLNDEQAENIIQARDSGAIWTDYQKFCEQFDIMPHQWADVEEKIIFPLKQANRYGRKVD